jgi:outer membrane protein TolC
LAAAVLVALALSAPAGAVAPADAEGKPWTLEALQAAAQASDPRVLSAAAEVQRLRAAESGARVWRWPALDYAASASGPVPETWLRTGGLGSAGVRARLDATLTWPVYAFGRAAEAEAAARTSAAGAGAAQAARARAARDAAEIFWTYQQARRGVLALEDVDRQLAGARERLDRLATQGSSQATRQDLAQLDVVRADLAARRAEAIAARDLALEAARVVAGAAPDAPFALASTTLEAPAVTLAPLTRYVEVAQGRRPELAAAQETVRGREAQLAARRRAMLPELVAFAVADLNWTGALTPQTNAFAYDPYNRLWAGLGLALRGRIDLTGDRAALAGDEASLERARADLEGEARAVRLEVARAHGALRAGLERAARLRDEEAAGRRWLSQAELAFDAGKADAQGVLLAALAAARAGVERLAAARDAQLALADLALATGEDPRAVK